MSRFIHCNGAIIAADKEIVTAGNRGLRYGDGLFETMKMLDGKIKLAHLHYDRLLNGLTTLQFQIPAWLTGSYLTEKIIALCQKNDVEKAARIRLSVLRGNGTLTTLAEPDPYIIIQVEPLAATYVQWNEKGLIIDIYPDARKSCDILSNLKSNNYLPYIMAAQYAKQQQWDDALLLNSYNRICDGTMANIFWMKAGTIYTTPLSEGCVAGVMRRFLLEQEPAIKEKILTAEALLQADEVCFTNALFGIKWVKQFRHKTYSPLISKQLYEKYIPS